MGLGDFLRKQFLDVIHWTEPGDDVLAMRYPMADMEIQYGAQLTVRPAQLALFVNEGIAADQFEPGRYELTTSTLPVLTNLKSWMFGFESPFKSDVYFFSTRQQLGQRWGTQQPITIRDQEFGAVRLRAFGTYTYHLTDARRFHERVSGTRDVVRAGDVESQLRALIIANAAQAFASSGTPFLDLAANTAVLSGRIRDAALAAFAELGLALDGLVVESLSLPEELQGRLDARIGMGMLGDLGQYTRLQTADALPAAAANPGGAAGAGVGLGAGLAMGQSMAQGLQGAPATAETKFCSHCGKSIQRSAKFCPECGGAQG